MSGATSSAMLESACVLASEGLAVHWLRSKTKKPLTDDWSTLPVNTPGGLRASWRDGLNVGIRLGEWSKVGGRFMHVIDMDVRVAAKAHEALSHLQRMLPDVDDFPFVISGSGGASRHFYLLTDRPFRSRKLVHSTAKFTDTEGKQHWEWEIELFGTGKQVACPPSIHPDTGKEYVWGRPIDFDLVAMDLGPIVSAEVVQAWGVSSIEMAIEEDELAAEVHRAPLDLKDDDVQEILDDLPLDEYCEDREGWLTVGMALHHQYEGGDKGFELWNKFSAQSKKFKAKDQRTVWDSFRGRLVPVRMPTLIKAAGIARLERDHDEGGGDSLGFDDPAKDPEIAALLGDAPTSADDIDSIGTTPSGREWLRLLDLNEEGVIKPTLHNLVLIVRNDSRTRGVASLNLFTQEIVQRSIPGKFRRSREGAKPAKQLEGSVWRLRDKVNGDLWSESKDNAIRDLIEGPKTQGGYGIKVTDRDLKAAVDLVAQEGSFHPIREYLDGLKWDGKERVDTLFIRYLGTPDNCYTRDTARLTLLGAVARAYEPGHKFDFVSIFEGKQGKGKSTFIKILGRNWFTELHGDFSDRQNMIEKMQGAWILEIPELSAFTKSEVEEIKAFISATEDKDRLAYDRRAKAYERQSIFLGSTNNTSYLRDDTGNRRFWPILCTVDSINTDRFAREVDQVWAEAVTMYKAMRAEQRHGTLPLFLQGEALGLAIEMQESRRIDSPEEIMAGKIAAWLNDPVKDPSGFDDVDDLLGGPILRDEVCLAELWTECLGRDFAQMAVDRRGVTVLGQAMRHVSSWVFAGRQRTSRFGQQSVFKRL